MTSSANYIFQFVILLVFPQKCLKQYLLYDHHFLPIFPPFRNVIFCWKDVSNYLTHLKLEQRSFFHWVWLNSFLWLQKLLFATSQRKKSLKLDFCHTNKLGNKYCTKNFTILNGSNCLNSFYDVYWVGIGRSNFTRSNL